MLALATGVLIGAALACLFLGGLLARQQKAIDAAYLDGFEAGVADAKAEANLRARWY